MLNAKLCSIYRAKPAKAKKNCYMKPLPNGWKAPTVLRNCELLRVCGVAGMTCPISRRCAANWIEPEPN